MYYKKLLKPFLFRLDAERAHNSTIIFAQLANDNALLRSLAHLIYYYQSDLLQQDIWDLSFSSPVGLAAGFDKNGLIAPLLSDLGFGFVEIGSVTAHASKGNPRPRAFRLAVDHGLINRMGLNNDGVDIISKRIQQTIMTIPLGVNIAKTHDPAIMGNDAIEDYLYSYKKMQGLADYITLNISCPNTTEGKTFENKEALNNLLSAIEQVRLPNAPPTLVKFSVDINKETLTALVETCEQYHIAGYVATNTSSQRTNLQTNHNRLQNIGNGGLSGRPIADNSTKVIRWINDILKGQKTIIGVGGIDSVKTALDKIRAGADLIQVYTGLIYEGPGLVKTINKGLHDLMARHNISSISELRSMDSK